MEIKASCKFSFDSVKALMHLTMFGKGNPKKLMIIQSVIFGVLLALMVSAIIYYGADLTLFILLFVGVFFVSLWYVLYFALPKIRYNALANLREAENEYIFCDDGLKTFTKSKEYTGEAKIQYSVFVKAYETSGYFFLYQTKDQIFIVDKSTIEGGSADDIRNKLKSSVKKYFICRY